MDMPKTRFTAKIQDATSDVDSEQQALDKFKNDLFNHCQDNLISLQKHKNPDGKQTLFAVVETSNDQTHEAIQHSLQTNKLDDQHNLVLLDKKTHDTIQQLAELGLITINQQTEKLFESPTTINTQKKQQKARIQKARKHLEQTDRKYRMASLLADGGFYQEAIAPLIETVSTALAAFAYVNQQLPNLANNNIAIEKLQQTLRESTEIPHELLDNILSMQNCVIQVNGEQIKTWLKNTDSVINFVEQSFNKLALS
jgi:non-ribosomal peptide synthetase component F